MEDIRKRKILHLCTTDAGGAGGAVVRINKLFNERGYDSAILVFKKVNDDVRIVDVSKGNFKILALKVFRKVFHELQKSVNRKIVNRYNFFNYSEKLNYLPSKLIFPKLPFRPDLIIVHYTSHYLNTRNVYEMQIHTGARVMFTMMDMSPLTGGCHYAWDCKGYENFCGNCPAISSNHLADETYRSMKYKKEYLDKIHPTMVVATEWSLMQAQKSTLFKSFPFEKILLPVDDNLFRPGNRIHAKNSFHLNNKKRVMFVGAQNISDERKGFFYLFAALNILFKKMTPEARNQILVLAAGDKDISKFIPFEVKHLGIIKGNEMLVKAYHASDLFVCPSVEDSGPMMINESIMCGTPVVSFEMGVSLDLVNSKTGYRAKYMDVDDLAFGIEYVLFHENLDQFPDSCRQVAMDLFSNDSVFNKWEKAIDKILN